MQNRHARLLALALLLSGCGMLGGRAATTQVRREPAAPTAPATASALPAKVAPASATAAEVARGGCPITRPPEPRFEPPPPHSRDAPSPGEFWYGSESLWTAVPGNGLWSDLPHNPEGYTQKLAWWREGYSWTEEPQPKLTVSGRRLDTPAPPLKASRATNAFTPEIGSVMLVGVDFPTPGCWEITGRYADAELSFVVQVEP